MDNRILSVFSCFWGGIMLLVFFPGTDTRAEEAITIEGRLTKTFRGEGKLPKSLEDMPFSVTVSTNQYSIYLWERGPNSPQKYWVASDRKDVFQNYINLDAPSESRHNWNGSFSKHEFPSRCSTAVQLLYLTFVANGDYQTAYHTNRVFNLAGALDGVWTTINCVWQTNEAFANNNKVSHFEIWAPGKGTLTGENEKYEMPPAYANGYLMASYSATNFVENGDFFVPKSALFKLYIPTLDHRPENPLDVTLHNGWFFTVDSITRTNVGKIAPVPEKNDSVFVIDERKTEAGAFLGKYSLSFSDELPFKGAAKYTSLQTSKEETQTSKENKRIFILIVIFGFSTVFLFLVLKKNGNSERGAETTNNK